MAPLRQARPKPRATTTVAEAEAVKTQLAVGSVRAARLEGAMAAGAVVWVAAVVAWEEVEVEAAAPADRDSGREGAMAGRAVVEAMEAAVAVAEASSRASPQPLCMPPSSGHRCICGTPWWR